MINDDLSPELKRDIVNIAGISAIPSLLNVICKTTGMGFAAVARVTDKNGLPAFQGTRSASGFPLATSWYWRPPCATRSCNVPVQ